MKANPDLSRLVMQVHLIEHVEDRRKLVAVASHIVHTAVNSNEANTLFRKIDFRVEPCL